MSLVGDLVLTIRDVLLLPLTPRIPPHTSLTRTQASLYRSYTLHAYHVAGRLRLRICFGPMFLPLGLDLFASTY